MDLLRTERLILRRWKPADREPFAAMNADPEVMRYFPAVLGREASDALIDRIEAGFAAHGYGLWAVEVAASNTFIGFTGLALQEFPAHFTPAVEIGWRLRPSAWGHGYATEAARAAVDYGFGASGLSEIVSMTTVTNHRSRAVMQRLHMSHTPTDDFENPRVPAGHVFRPHVLYRLSTEAWRQSQAGVRKSPVTGSAQ